MSADSVAGCRGAMVVKARRIARARGTRVMAIALVGSLCILVAPTAAIGAAERAGAAQSRSLADDMVTPTTLLGRAAISRMPLPNTLADVNAFAQYNHSADIAVVVPSDSAGWSTTFSDSNTATLVSRLAAYWSAQTNGQVASITRTGVVQRYLSGYPCSDQQNAWSEAALRFGHSLDYYVSTTSHHLIVLVPADCAESGSGSVGTGANSAVSTSNGGTIWASVNGLNDLDTVAHEFGHNLGLVHSHSQYCPTTATNEGVWRPLTATFSDGCIDQEYGDAYDIMGAAWRVMTAGGLIANANPTTLNVTQEQRLVPLAAGQEQVIASAATLMTASLASTGASTGLRDLKITDPVSGEVYYVDYRGGGGADAGSLYEGHYLKNGSGNQAGADLGVRVSTVRGDGGSSVLMSPDTSSANGRKLYLTVGQSLTTRTGAVTVTLNNITASNQAMVTVSLLPAQRISGTDRFATAIAIAQAGYPTTEPPTTVPVVYLATGSNYPDALAAAPAAALLHGPLLLTPSDSLPANVSAEITRLRPARIVVAGGEGAISAHVLSQLAGLAPTVIRISGTDRYQTARQVVRDAFPGSTSPGAVRSAYLATGLNYPDALSAAAAAGAAGVPVLLANGQADSVDAATLELIRYLGVTTVTIVGGTVVVSPGMESSLVAAGLTVSRVGGSDRFQTSQMVSENAFPTGAPQIFLATGYQFPDALAGAALAGLRRSPLYVVPPTCVPARVLSDIASSGASRITLLGGATALSDSVLKLQSCG